MKYILLATILALTLTASSPFALGQTAVEAWVQRHDETNHRGDPAHDRGRQHGEP